MRETTRRRAALGALALGLLLAMTLAVSAGSVGLSPFASMAALFGAGEMDATGRTILLAVRLPRVLLAALVGGGLGIVGAALQALFRNPMADAGLLGVGPGAAFGAVLAVNLGLHTAFLGLPIAAFAGAMAAVLLVYVLAHAGGRPSLHGLLLTGLAVAAVAGAGTSVLLVATEEFRVRTVLFWLSGSLEGRGWEHVRLAAGFVGLGSLALAAFSRPLDVLSLGEVEAQSLSLPVHRTRMAVFALASLIAGPATAFAGAVPFVGLVAPHALRPLVGPLARHLLPASFLGGAILVVVADAAARSLSAQFDLPLGSLTAFVGAPYFLYALRTNEGRE